MNNKQRNIVAAAALSSVAEARALSLKIEFSHLLSNNDIQSINEQIKNKTGIDLLNWEIAISPKQIERYESELDNFIKSNLKNIVDSPTLAEEVKLIENTFDYPIHDFKSMPFKQASISRAVRSIFKAINVPISSIEDIIMSPSRVQVMKSVFNEYLCLSKCEIRGKSFYALFHTGTGPYADAEKVGFKNMFEKLDEANFHPGGHVHVVTCFFFTEETAYHAEPVMLFLKGLNKYGKEATIDGISKKFFFKGYTSSLLLNNSDLEIKKGIIGTNALIIGNVSARETYTGYDFGLIYLLRGDRMVNDYKSRIFQ